MEKFKSRYTTTDKDITPAQFLAEKICERIARKNKTVLTDQFWNQTKWKRTFLYQVQIANSLLKIYSWQAILSALKKNPGVYSLNAKFLDPHIKCEQEILDREVIKPKEVQPLELADPTAKPRPSFTEQKSTRAKLREL
jgi:sulfur relay (sulfurtransferase) DsrC/TusE family protein